MHASQQGRNVRNKGLVRRCANVST